MVCVLGSTFRTKLLPPSPQSSSVEETDQARGRWSGISRMPSQDTENELLLATDNIRDLLLGGPSEKYRAQKDTEVGSCKHTMPLIPSCVPCRVCAIPNVTHSRHRLRNHASPALETALHTTRQQTTKITTKPATTTRPARTLSMVALTPHSSFCRPAYLQASQHTVTLGQTLHITTPLYQQPMR